MRIYNKYLLVFALAFGLFGCESFIGGDINEDPNNPTSVPISAQMPNIGIEIADNYGGSFSRFNCMMMQQVEGVARQWSSFNQYTGLTPNRFDAPWTNLFENTLNEIQIAKASASENGFNHTLGILQTMEAFALMMGADVWDDIPYSEAFKGVDNINPTFDAQSEIYRIIFDRLDSAISLFAGPSGSVSTGSEDVFYGGDVAAWEKAAHAIKARGFMKLGDFNQALQEAGKSFTGAADNMSYQYPDANNAGPWYRFNDGRTGDIEFHPTMRQIMTDLNDVDRLGLWDQTFITSHPYMIASWVQEVITYREMQFIIAEADFRATGGSQVGYDAYLAGIKASFERCGFGDTEYNAYIANAAIDKGVGNLTLEDIMIQKYIALYLDPEVYSDWRRTGIPSLTPVSGTTIPVRWHYSANEYLFNANITETDVNIFTDKVGWNR